MVRRHCFIVRENIGVDYQQLSDKCSHTEVWRPWSRWTNHVGDVDSFDVYIDLREQRIGQSFITMTCERFPANTSMIPSNTWTVWIFCEDSIKLLIAYPYLKLPQRCIRHDDPSSSHVPCFLSRGHVDVQDILCTTAEEAERQPSGQRPKWPQKQIECNAEGVWQSAVLISFTTFSKVRSKIPECHWSMLIDARIELSMAS